MSKTYKKREKSGKRGKEWKEEKGGKGEKEKRVKKTYKKRKNQIQSQGFMKTITMNNSVKNEGYMEWNNQYDGKKAELNVMTNLNGKKQKYHIQMNNQEIERLLSQPSVKDKRLINDFSMH